VIGADIGQLSDPTAIAVVECTPSSYPVPVLGRDPVSGLPREEETFVEGPPVTFAVRHLERPPLGTDYVRVVARIEELSSRLPGSLLVVDATGVGLAVCDMLAETGLQPVRVTITAGSEPQGEGLSWRVPKQRLIAGMQVALGSGRLRVAASLALAAVLVRELQDYRLKVTAAANVTFSAREGAHDDLLLAVALAVWGGQTACSQPREVVVIEEMDRVEISPF